MEKFVKVCDADNNILDVASFKDFKEIVNTNGEEKVEIFVPGGGWGWLSDARKIYGKNWGRGNEGLESTFEAIKQL